MHVIVLACLLYILPDNINKRNTMVSLKHLKVTLHPESPVFSVPYIYRLLRNIICSVNLNIWLTRICTKNVTQSEY